MFKGRKVADQGLLGDPLHGLITTSFCLAGQSSPVCLLESNVPASGFSSDVTQAPETWELVGACLFVFKFYSFLLGQQP